MENVRKYFKRDISWLSFNYRVLMEAMDHTVPLFDRIKFLSIYQSNQEEFYRVRVSEYHQILSDPLQSIEDKRQAENTLSAINQEVNRQFSISSFSTRLYLNLKKKEWCCITTNK